ncbi:hypothetical protein [Falsiroseomonas sp.]|uniref:DUF7168 domain-containing protein n=1 Tax=Falsiroseomonas sp. TaxID=2870721 RepID=UPI0027193AA7|nr:hypothetical protein [Falsiroseomonas sp.]MDO9499012.1 hypothetical protein [Falsiroseomonas sp.]
MDKIEDVKALIRTLLGRTPARGFTEAEAIAAAEKAMDLMRRHQLSEHAVMTAEGRVTLRTKRTGPADRLWGVVAHACRCRVLIETSHVGRAAAYVGRDPWPEVAVYLHQVVDGAVDRAGRDFARSAEAKRRKTARTRSEARTAYLTGFVVGLAQKLRDLFDPLDPQHASDLNLADAAMDAKGPMKTLKLGKLRAAARFSDVVQAGISAGRATPVSLGVRNSGAPLAIAGARDDA